jgi:mannose-6-phosphate isomerase-like protein (cupin superfamily)
MRRLTTWACALVALLGVVTPLSAADSSWTSGIYRVNDARGPIRPVGLLSPWSDISSEIVAGPTNGIDTAFLIYTRMAVGAKARGLYTLPVEHTYLVLSGKLNVQIGSDQFVVAPQTLVLVPAGVPHQAWNAGSEAESDFEVVAPAPSRDLLSMMQRAQARKVDNAAQYVRVAPTLETLAGGTGHESLNERVLASRETGSEHVLERLNDVLPGGGRTELHIHPFDQVYFITKGTMTVQYGMSTYEAGENTLVLLPAGIVHNNQNKGTSLQSAITLLLPEPEKGMPFGASVELQRTPSQRSQ